MTNPGNKRAWRIYDQRGMATADLIALEDENPGHAPRIVLRHPSDFTRFRTLEQRDVARVEPLLVDVVREGRLVYESPSIEAMREQRNADVQRLDLGVRRLVNPHIYHVSLSEQLWALKQRLVEELEG
jgi:nicotinate phosphoribosyltransferase